MRALISVHDKTGVVDLARGLVELGWEVVSSGGTSKALQEAGVPVTPARVPSSTSCDTVAWYFPRLTHYSPAITSSPTSWTEALRCSGLVFSAFVTVYK